MKNLAEQVRRMLEADKKNYRHIFYNPITGKLFLVKECYRLYQGKKFLRKEVDFYDGKLFGNRISLNRTKNWQHVGTL